MLTEQVMQELWGIWSPGFHPGSLLFLLLCKDGKCKLVLPDESKVFLLFSHLKEKMKEKAYVFLCVFSWLSYSAFQRCR